jgi:hypothetical protein
MINAADLRSLCLLSAVRPAGATEPYSSPPLIGGGSSPPCAAPRRVSADLVAERYDAAIDMSGSGSARVTLETTLMTRSRPRRGLSISPGSNSRPFFDLVGAGQGGCRRPRNAAGYGGADNAGERNHHQHTNEAPSVKVIAGMRLVRRTGLRPSFLPQSPVAAYGGQRARAAFSGCSIA